MTSLDLALARAIRGALSERDMTQEDLAHAAGMSLNTLKNYLSTTGRRSGSMSVDTLTGIAAALNMEPADLINRAVAIQSRE